MTSPAMIDPTPQQSAQIINIAPHHDMKSFEALMAMSARVGEEMTSEMQVIQRLHPEWHQKYEDTPAETSSAIELMNLLESAPNSFAKGLVSGALQVRLEIASVTGRMF